MGVHIKTGVRGGTCASDFIQCLKDAKNNNTLSAMKSQCNINFANCCKENRDDMSCPQQGGALSYGQTTERVRGYFGIAEKAKRKSK